QYYAQTLDSICRHFKGSMNTPWAELPEAVRDTILNGSRSTPIQMHYRDGLRTYETEKPFEGVLPNLERRYRETESAWIREELSRFQSDLPCEACTGFRLKPQGPAVKIERLTISAGADS